MSRGEGRSGPARVAHRASLAPLLLIGALVAGWALAVRITDVPDYVLPSPGEVMAVLVSDAGVLLGHAVATVGTAVLGMIAGAAVGIGLALLMASSQTVRAALYPILVVSQSIPMVVLAPLFVVWFGFGLLPRLLVVALVAFFPVAVGTLEGLLGADHDRVDLVRAMGAGRRELYRHVLIPGSLQSLFTGLKVAASYAMFAAVVGEWIGASRGLGIYLERSRASFATDQMFAAVVVIAAVSVALFAAVVLLERLAMPWQAAESEERARARVAAGW